MKLTVIGAGNIGLITALIFAKNKHQVCCLDSNQNKIDLLKSGTPTFFEPGLFELLNEQIITENIEFTTNEAYAINSADIIFIAVGTPSDEFGKIDMTSIENVTEKINKLSQNPKTIIIKSTVLPGTSLHLAKKYSNLTFISSPEFLREGTALNDCLKPDRVIIGSTANDNSKANVTLLKNIYAEFNLNSDLFISMDSVTAELTKYASNVFLASRISLMNEFSRLCEKSGANIDLLKLAIGYDKRIGAEYLNAGIGYGGSCLPKDVDALINYANSIDENLNITKAIKYTNELQIQKFTEKIIKYFETYNIDKIISIWGLSFKPNTDDLRESPAIKLITNLLAENFKLNLFDPQMTLLNNPVLHSKNVTITKNTYESVKNTNALVICTDWSEFKDIDFKLIKENMNTPVIFDGRNMYLNDEMKKMGFNYNSVGR